MMITKPEILTHPNIPKPLHGLNPRTIFGEKWWNEKRQEIYARYDYHCISCGIHKSQAKKHKWLEAHEFYDIDYEKGTVKIKSIEPLCHYCHNFIHSGRLKMIMGKEKTKEEVIEILEHGFKILHDNKLQCFHSTLLFANQLGCKVYDVISYTLPDEKYDAKWEDWKLVIEEKSYEGNFKSYEEWKQHYNN